MDTRIAHDYTRRTREDRGTGSFAYDVDANGTRRPHDGFTMALRHHVTCKMQSRMFLCLTTISYICYGLGSSLGVVMGCRIGEKVWSGTGNASKYIFRS